MEFLVSGKPLWLSALPMHLDGPLNSLFLNMLIWERSISQFAIILALLMAFYQQNLCNHLTPNLASLATGDLAWHLDISVCIGLAGLVAWPSVIQRHYMKPRQS